MVFEVTVEDVPSGSRRPFHGGRSLPCEAPSRLVPDGHDPLLSVRSLRSTSKAQSHLAAYSLTTAMLP
jgi:hypothetical protein